MIWYSQEHFYQAHTGERDQISPLRKGSVKNEFVVLKLTGNELKRSSSRLPVCAVNCDCCRKEASVCRPTQTR